MHDFCESVLIINWALGHNHGTKIERVVLNRVCILGIFCPKQGQGFKPSAAHLYPNIGRVPPPLPPRSQGIGSQIFAISSLFCFVEQKLMCVTRRDETNNGNLDTTPGAEALKCASLRIVTKTPHEYIRVSYDYI